MRSARDWFQRRPEREFDGPVAWLFGRELVGSIKGILLYIAYGKKLDPRDWMDAQVFPPGSRTAALEFWRDPSSELAASKDPAGNAEGFWEERGEFWFDYIADTGDGTAATYSVAYLCGADLYAAGTDEGSLRAAPEVFTAGTRPQDAAVLRRGEFLLIGGDTSYHVSDYITLANRFQSPFSWAYEDLCRDLKEPAHTLRNRPLFGIPGNHDYYDQLDGFRRQFRRAVDAEPVYGLPSAPDPRRLTPQLCIPGYFRCQSASYIALQLPFGWSLWGLDTEVGQIDRRQQAFFKAHGAGSGDGATTLPRKLILATCAPTTVFGKLASVNDEKAYDAILQLGLPTPFRPLRRADGTLMDTGDAQLGPGECRLDLSGDVHHYARYWGPRRGGGHSRPGARHAAPDARSYASIVAGLGGAFHHPTRTYLDEVQEQTLYPDESTSTAAVIGRLLSVRHIARGGFIWLAGAVIAFVVTFAANIPQSSRQIVNNFVWMSPLGLVHDPSPVTPTTLTVAGYRSTEQSVGSILGRAPTALVAPAYTALVWRSWRYQPPDMSELDCRDIDRQRVRASGAPLYFYWPCRVPWPTDYVIGLVLFLTAPMIPLALTFSRSIFRRTSKGGSVGADQKGPPVETSRHTETRPAAADTEIEARPAPFVWLGTVVPTLALWIGLAWMKPYRELITPFGSSIVTFWTFLWVVATVSLALRYSEFLFKRSHATNVRTRDWAPVWALPLVGLFGGAFGLWSFGKNNLPALLTSDLVCITVCLGTLLGVSALPFYAGGELLANKTPVGRNLGAVAIGTWHATIQLLVPFLLVRRGGWLTFIIVGAAMVGFRRVGMSLMRRDRAVLLALAWISYGIVMVTVPWWTTSTRLPFADELHVAPFGLAEVTPWQGLLRSLVAASVGAVISCSFFGWYLAVCFMFNGHNNETGGAARVEDFKGFVRVCLRKESLTVYAIAVDRPARDGRDLSARVIDVFTLRTKPADDHAERCVGSHGRQDAHPD